LWADSRTSKDGVHLSELNYSIRENKGGSCEKVSLGNTTVKVSTPTKWQLLSMVQDMLQGSNYRVLNCQKAIGQVQIFRGEERAYFGGVMACESVWLCPVCNRRIAYERAQMIRKTLDAGYKMILLTTTLQHSKADALDDLLDALKLALRKLKQGRWWKDFRERWGVEAYISSYEITYGYHGWHPHTHIIIYLSKEIDVQEFWTQLVQRYVKLVEKGGHYASEYHGLDVREAEGEAVANYLTKWRSWDLSNELVNSSAKQGREGGQTFWELVASGRDDLVQEYAHATFGLKSLTWSHGAKELLGVKDDSDNEQEYDPENEPVVIAKIPEKVWNVIRSRSLQGYCLELAVMDQDALGRYLRELEAGINQ
jgi:hypothetical protein